MNRSLFLVAIVLALAGALVWVSARKPAREVEALVPAAPAGVETVRTGAEVLSEVEPAKRVDAAAPTRPGAPESALTPTGVLSSLAPGESELVVRVVSIEEKKPIARVRLRLGPLGPRGRSGVQYVEGSLARLGEAPATDEAGSARFILPSGDAYELDVLGGERFGEAAAEVPALSAGERREIVLAVQTQDDRRFFGRLLAEEDGAPIANGRIGVPSGRRRVTIQSPRAPMRPNGTLVGESEPPKLSTSDADGLFEISFSSWKTKLARIVAPGRSLLLTNLPDGHDTPERALAIRLKRSASVAARVVDARGSGLGDVAVRLSAHSYSLLRSEGFWSDADDPAWEQMTTPDGRAALADLPAGTLLTLELVRDRAVLRRDVDAFSLAPGEERSIELRVGGGARLRGRIIDQHQEPVANHEVWLKNANALGRKTFQEYETVGARTRTDAQGSFAFEDLAEGAWWVGPAARSRYGVGADVLEDSCAPIAERIEVAPGAVEVEVLVRTHRGLALRGLVIDPLGNPAAGCFVSCRSAATPSFATGYSAADGRFAAGPLMPGEYQLVANGGSSGHASSEAIAASAGEVDITLRLRAGGKVEGRVVDRETKEACEALVTLSCGGATSSRFEGATPTQTRKSRFSFEGQLPRTCSLSAQTSDGLCGVVESVAIEAGKTTPDIVIEVDPGATLQIRCTGDKGRGSYRVYSGSVCVVVGGLPAGTVSEQTVPAGQLVIKAFTAVDLPAEEQTIAIAKGETRQVVIRPRR